MYVLKWFYIYNICVNIDINNLNFEFFFIWKVIKVEFYFVDDDNIYMIRKNYCLFGGEVLKWLS